MPFAAKAKCKYAGCGECKPCPKHGRVGQADTKTSAERRFYSSYAWQKLRAQHARLEPLCRECLNEGKATPGALSDHIVRVRDGGDPLSLANLQRLCDMHHNQKRRAEASTTGGGH